MRSHIWSGTHAWVLPSWCSIYHARPRRAFEATAMRAALLRLGREPGRLERLLDPGVAASAAALAVPRMKVLGAPTQMPLAVLLGERHHLVHRCPKLATSGSTACRSTPKAPHPHELRCSFGTTGHKVPVTAPLLLASAVPPANPPMPLRISSSESPVANASASNCTPFRRYPKPDRSRAINPDKSLTLYIINPELDISSCLD